MDYLDIIEKIWCKSYEEIMDETEGLKDAKQD